MSNQRGGPPRENREPPLDDDELKWFRSNRVEAEQARYLRGVIKSALMWGVGIIAGIPAVVTAWQAIQSLWWGKK
jgi:hypothetical protein